MTETELELARELARHPKWKWERGMLAVCGNRLERVVLTADDGRGLLCGTDVTSPEHYPDLSDPATQGCLIAMLGSGNLCISSAWRIYDENGARRAWTVTVKIQTYRGDTLGEALARAWLAVNREEPKP